MPVHLDLQKATTSLSLLLTFKEKGLPRFKETPGEQAKTKDYEYYEREMGCKTCLRHGHIVDGCRETIATCVRFSSQGHNTDK